MNYQSVTDTILMDAFHRSYNYYKSRYKGKFKISLRLIPIEDPVYHHHKPNHKKYKSINREVGEEQGKAFEWKHDHVRQRNARLRTEVDRINQETIKLDNKFGSLSLECETYMSSSSDVYDCEFEIVEPDKLNDFFIVNNSYDDFSQGKTTYRSALIISDKHIPHNGTAIRDYIQAELIKPENKKKC